MDDLKVAPMSTISSITLLNTFGITDISMLEEKTVHIGYEEVIIYIHNILKYSCKELLPYISETFMCFIH
jgi:hypothetical protein